MNNIIVKAIEALGDIAISAELAKYASDLEGEVSRLRHLNEEFIKIINNLKNRGVKK